jgi:hypothetical protein
MHACRWGSGLKHLLAVHEGTVSRWWYSLWRFLTRWKDSAILFAVGYQSNSHSLLRDGEKEDLTRLEGLAPTGTSTITLLPLGSWP